MGIRNNAGANAAVLTQPDVAVAPILGADLMVVAPQKPIKQLGKAKAPATQAPAASSAAGSAVTPVTPDFTGAWNSRTDKNWNYDVTFLQQGNNVTGIYIVENTTRGRIRGTVTGNTLDFNWDQDGGYTGTGQFVLAADGKSFQGTYRVDPNPTLTPDLLQGTWAGTRK